MHHNTNNLPFDTTSDESSIAASCFLQDAAEDTYLMFLQMQEALMTPYGEDSGMYTKLLPVAAQLTTAAVTLAASQSKSSCGTRA